MEPVQPKTQATVYTPNLPEPFSRLPLDIIKLIFDKFGASEYKALMTVSKQLNLYCKSDLNLLRQLMKLPPRKTEMLGLLSPSFGLEGNNFRCFFRPTREDHFLFIAKIFPQFEKVKQLHLEHTGNQKYKTSEEKHENNYRTTTEKPSFVDSNMNDYSHWTYIPGQYVIGYCESNSESVFHVWSIKDVPMPKSTVEKIIGTAKAVGDVIMGVFNMIAIDAPRFRAFRRLHNQ